MSIFSIKPMIKSSFYTANTLNDDYIGHHDNGWIVQGEIMEDYYSWVNDFTAFNEEKGYVVFGNFEETVYANCKEAYEEFIKLFPPQEWDYGDI